MTEALLMYEDEGRVKLTALLARGEAFSSGQSRKWPLTDLERTTSFFQPVDRETIYIDQVHQTSI